MNEEEVEGEEERIWLHESYKKQMREYWPGRGNHILAQYDDDTVVVYQAYRKEIADYAVQHKKFAGCPLFGETRTTWIKTNFTWMMFRSKWGGKPNQTNILAIWLRRDRFEYYLENAKEKGTVRGMKGTVRLQWDPDHNPDGSKCVYRRALQLGLKNIQSYVQGEDILSIQDISEFVREQGKKVKKKGHEEILEVARERVFIPFSEKAKKAVNLSPLPEFLKNRKNED